MSRVVYIYALCEPGQPHNVRYIGKTVKPLEHRLAEHIWKCCLPQCDTHKDRWLRVLRGKGEIPLIKLLDIGTEDTWEELERSTILAYREAGFRLVNGTDGGDGIKGHMHSIETRVKLSNSHKGKSLSTEACAKVSLSLLGNKRSVGRKHSDSTRAKMSESHKGNTHAYGNKNRLGKTFSEESKKKISTAVSKSLLGNTRKLGKKDTPETLAKKSVAQKERWRREREGL